MADIKQLERALIKADAAGDADAAKAFASEIRKMRTVAPQQESSVMADVAQGAGNVVAGAVRGAGSIGATILAPYDMAKDALAGKGLSLESNRQRRADMDGGLQAMGAQPDSLLYQGGKLGGEIAGTAGVGGVLANGVRAVSQAPQATALANAIASGGFRTGATPGLLNMGTRAAGGAINGGASAALVNPEDAATGAAIGAALPPAVSAIGNATRYVGRTAQAVAQPFTERGQEAIAGNVVRRFADGGPTAMNAAELVPGSVPTLAEATGNAGIATLQRGARDINPNAFVERERLNAAARNAAFDGAAGDASQLAFYKASRSQAGNEMYGNALNREAEPLTPYLKGQITQLLKRPSIDAASRQAQKLALERGEKPAAMGSLQALQDVKTALGDNIAEATQAGKGGQVKALKATQNKLVDVMEKLSPDYAEANATYAAMSQPVNAMEALQGLKLTDAQGNVTLAKVKNAIEGLDKLRSAPGVNTAKSITDEQLGVLRALHEDLLRQSNLGAGRSIGSNTFQNIATDNILGTMLPGRLGAAVTGKVGGVLGQVGRLAYSGPNEAIRNRLADMMLQPQLAQNAFNPAAQQMGRLGSGFNVLVDYAGPTAFRSAPVIAAQ
jgi:hypothetical protein